MKEMCEMELSGLKKVLARISQIKKKRQGKFKVREKDFKEEMLDLWITAQLDAGMRVLKFIESDEEINTKDLIRGEIHLYILDSFSILKKRLKMKETITIEDLLEGDL